MSNFLAQEIHKMAIVKGRSPRQDLMLLFLCVALSRSAEPLQLRTLGAETTAAITAAARMRVQDTVARWGGEEFLVIVESVTRDESASIAESLRQMIEAGTGEILKTTISIGVAHSETGQSVDQILKRADEGLYAAKNSGRNKVVTV